MKSTTRFVTVLMFGTCLLHAQKKYERIIYVPQTVESPEMTVMSKDILGTNEMLKFQLKIMNKSDEVLLYKPDESSFMINGKESKPHEKKLVIYPTDSEHRVINLAGNGAPPEEFSFRVSGVYKISETDAPVSAPDFALPAANNDFKAGNFSCTMTDLKKESDRTTAKFECRYTGDKVGVINPSRAAVKLPDGTEIANAKSKGKSELLSKGESTKITLTWNRMEGGRQTDMQKIKMDIVWRNTFVESEAMAVPPVELHMKINPAESK